MNKNDDLIQKKKGKKTGGFVRGRVDESKSGFTTFAFIPFL